MVNTPRTVRASLTASVGRARNCCIALALLFIPAEARAHFHKAGAFGAVSWAKGSRLAGFQLSVDFPVTTPEEGNDWKPLYIVFADAGANWGLADSGQRTQTTGMIGVRAVWGDWKIQPFVHSALATIHTQGSAARLADTTVGLGVGGGLSISLRDECDRKEPENPCKYRNGLFLRMQYDVVATGWPKGLFPRYQRASVGIEFRFPRRTD
jgi:hypothetical protein